MSTTIFQADVPLWPTVNSDYEVPEGIIALDVHEAGGKVWKKAVYLIRAVLKDDGMAFQVMQTALAKVTEIRSRKQEPIKSLPNYILRTFRHQLCDEWKRQSRMESLSGEVVGVFVELFAAGDVSADYDSARTADMVILLRQIVSLMDDWTRETFDFLKLGYTFEEIAQMRGVPSNRVRSRYYRGLMLVARRMEGGAAGVKG